MMKKMMIMMIWRMEDAIVSMIRIKVVLYNKISSLVTYGEVGPHIQGCRPLQEQDLAMAGFATQDMVVISWVILGKSYSFGVVQTLQSVHGVKTRGFPKCIIITVWFGLA